MADYIYESAARWTERRRGLVECDQSSAALEFSAPTEFQGDAGFWTPEHLLLGAIASCFVTTFRAIAELSKFAFISLEVSAQGTLAKAGTGFEFDQITLRPILTLTDDAHSERGIRLLEKAEHACLIARSLKTPVTLKPHVELEVAREATDSLMRV